MEIFTKTENPLVIGIRGEVDADNCGAMADQVLAVHQSDPEVLVDLSEMTFLDSSGISAFLELKTTVEEQDRSLRLTHPTDSVRRVLEITGLTTVFGL